MNRIKKALEKCRTYVAVQKFGCGITGIGHGVEDNILQFLNEADEELAWLERREPTLESDCISAGLPIHVALKYDVQLCRLTNYVRDKALADYVKQYPVGMVEASEEWGVAGVLIAGLPLGTKLYAAPVSAKREWVDLTVSDLDAIIEKHYDDEMDLKAMILDGIAAFKEKNK